MARALQDILTELNSVYDPQRQSYSQQIGALDPQLQAEEQGLQAQKQDAFQGITDQANRRGLFYSGLPIAEEQRYTGQQYLPSVANLRSKYATQRFGLQDAIAKITGDQYNQAYNVRQGELDLEEKQRQFDQQLAASRAAAGGGGGFSPSYIPTGGASANSAAPTPPSALDAATDFANAQKQLGLQQDPRLLNTFYRDHVRDQLLKQYKGVLTPAQINDIVYKNVFQEGWNGAASRPAGGGGGGGGGF